MAGSKIHQKMFGSVLHNAPKSVHELGVIWREEMPQIIFTIDSQSNFQANQNGMVTIAPALAAQGRLYVVWSNIHQRPAYIGTSADVQQRFNMRLGAINNLGVLPAALQDNFVFTVRVNINGNNHVPNDQGVANGIDVEHLLIRVYINHYQIALRNTTKWNNAFQNNDLNGLSIRYLDPNNLVNGFPTIGNGGFVQLVAGLGAY